MVEATNLLGGHPTSISYVFKMFQHPAMLWMGIWVHPYTVMPVQVGVDFRKIETVLSPSDVVMSLFRLQTHLKCIPHPYQMYAKCFNIWYEVDGHTGAPLHSYACAGEGWILGGTGLSPSDVVM